MRVQNIFFIITISFCKLFALIWGNLPPEIQKCKSTHNDECVARTIKDVLKRYPTGNPEFGMPNISALTLTSVKISRSNPNSPIQINFEFLKCTIYGLEKVKILKTSGFDKELKKVEVDVVATLKLEGDYEMTGKLLVLPLNGKGKAEIDLKDTNATFRVTMDKVQRDNKTYFKSKKFKAVLHPKQVVVKFQNVFNGNPVLSQTINDVINENWKDVWSELQEGINRATAKVMETAINKVYDVVPLEDMYAD